MKAKKIGKEAREQLSGLWFMAYDWIGTIVIAGFLIYLWIKGRQGRKKLRKKELASVQEGGNYKNST